MSADRCKVVVEYDGCANWQPADPAARGTRAECVAWIERHLAPQGCEFSVMDLETRRHVSFMFTPARRRARAQVVDITEE